MSIDPVTLARFLVLPGAERLVAAFSQVPPGPLRDSIISHAEVMASTYSGAPAESQMPDPLLMASQRQGTALAAAIAGPGRSRLNPDDPAVRIVELRKQGWSPQRIAPVVKMGVDEVQAHLKAARAAGLKFPVIHRDPDAKRPTFLTERAGLDGRAVGVMSRAAVQMGLDLEGYLQRRRELLALRARNTPIEELVLALKPVPEKTIWTWIEKARAAGHNIAASLDFEDAVIEPLGAQVAQGAREIAQAVKAAPPAKVTELKDGERVFLLPEQFAPHILLKIADAAAKRGMTAQALQDMRESIVRHRLAGLGGQEIELRTGMDRHFVRNTLTTAVTRGVVFPPLPAPAHQPAN